METKTNEFLMVLLDELDDLQFEIDDAEIQIEILKEKIITTRHKRYEILRNLEDTLRTDHNFKIAKGA